MMNVNRRQPLDPMYRDSSFLRKHWGKTVMLSAAAIWIATGMHNIPEAHDDRPAPGTGVERLEPVPTGEQLQGTSEEQAGGYDYLSAPAKVSLYTHYRYLKRSQGAKILSDYRQEAVAIPIGNLELPEVVMFADPDCVQCLSAFATLMPYLERGVLHLEVILAKSERAPFFYSAEDPTRMLLEHEVDLLLGGEGLQASVEPNATAKEWVDRNARYMESNGLSAFPTFVVRDPEGKARVYEGFSETLPVVLGLK